MSKSATKNISRNNESSYTETKEEKEENSTGSVAHTKPETPTLKLKNLYKSQNVIPQLIEVLADKKREQSIEDYYVKLNILLSTDNSSLVSSESVNGKKEEIELGDIFDKAKDKQTNKILILGGAGVGKSTLMQYVAHQWGSDKLWKDKFDCVYKITFKQLLLSDCQDFVKEFQRERDLGQDRMLKAFIAFNIEDNTDKAYDLVKSNQIELNDKTLLLIDGYDEVQHLDDKGVFKSIKDSILAHSQIIMTTRPNAADSAFKSNFGVLIENAGLDSNGISEYLDKYFQDKIDEKNLVQEFLNKSPNIKEICKIPVNIAMLCSILSEHYESGENSESLDSISNMGDLYHEMVTTLGKRFFAKTEKYTKDKNKSELQGNLKGVFNIDELKVLEHLAWNSFVNQDALILKGSANNKEDTNEPTLLSAINHVVESEHLTIETKPSLLDVYKYGLLKKELLKSANSDAENIDKQDKELEEQLFTFIHLTFQEYLTSYKLKELLKTAIKDNNQEAIYEACKFLADNRDNPKYLVVLKFMSGLISKEGNADLTQAFWESMTCNIEGVIDLGEDRKIDLFMNLLGQVSKDKLKDIANIEKITAFIDYKV